MTLLISTHKGELGIRSLSAFLRERQHPVRMIFAPLFESRAYGDGQVKDILDICAGNRGKVIGISSAGISHDRTLQLIQAIKEDKRLDSTRLVVGGPTATQNPKAFDGLADDVCIGEGEQMLLDIVEGRQVRQVQPIDLDNIPFYDYGDLSGRNFRMKNKVLTPITTQELEFPGIPNLSAVEENSLFVVGMRGCGYACSYCINRNLRAMYGAARKLGIEKFVNEIARLVSNFRIIRHVSIFDDDFFLRSKREIVEFSQRWRKQVNLPFFAYASPSTFTPEKLRLLAEAGMTKIGIGFQTGSEKMLAVYDRPARDIEKAFDIIREIENVRRSCRHFQIPDIDFLVDVPFEIAEDAKKTIEFIIRLAMAGTFEAHIHNLHLFPGSGLYEKVRGAGIVYDDSHIGYELQDHRPQMKKKLAIIGDKGRTENERMHAFYTAVLYIMTGLCNNSRLGAITHDEAQQLLVTPEEKIDDWIGFFEDRTERVSTTLYYTEREQID